MPTPLKRILRWAGSALAVLAGSLVILKLVSQAGELSEGALRASASGLALGIVGYALAGLLLAAVWWRLLALCSGRSPPVFPCMAAHLVSQIGKYVPGNVAHFAARHTLGRAGGFGHAALLAAALLESAMLVAVALGFSVAVAERLVDTGLLPGWLQSLIPWAPLASALGLLLTYVLARARGWVDNARSWRGALTELAIVYLLTLCFFSAAAVCLYLLLPDAGRPPWPDLLAWFAAAWLLGFILPGAPGGLGVREAVLVLGLAPVLGEAQAALAAVLLRIVTLGGDGLMGLVGWIGLRLSRSGARLASAPDA